MDPTVKPPLSEGAKHRTMIARLAASITHDLGNIQTLLQAGSSMPGTAVTDLTREGLARLTMLGEVVGALDRGVVLTEESAALETAVSDAAAVIRGAYDIDLQLPAVVHPVLCAAPRMRLTAAIYAALDAAARAARGCHPVRLNWVEDGLLAGIRIEVPSRVRSGGYQEARARGQRSRFGLEQALALTHKFGGFGRYTANDVSSDIELYWRKAGCAAGQPSGPVVWLGHAELDVFALLPAAVGWPRVSSAESLLTREPGLPCAVVGRVGDHWNHQPLLETLRWLRASGSTLLPLVCNPDEAFFIAEEFGADCPFIRWPQEMDRLSMWAQRLAHSE